MGKATVLMSLMFGCATWAGGLPCQIDGTCQGQLQPYQPPNAIVCAGTTGEQVIFNQLIETLRPGTYPAQLLYISAPLHPSVDITENPVFHTLVVGVETAYCAYHFTIDQGDEVPHLLRSAVNCEGQSRELQCELRAVTF